MRISYQYLVFYLDRVRSFSTIRRIVFNLNNHVRSKNELVIGPKCMMINRNEIEEYSFGTILVTFWESTDVVSHSSLLTWTFNVQFKISSFMINSGSNLFISTWTIYVQSKISSFMINYISVWSGCIFYYQFSFHISWYTFQYLSILYIQVLIWTSQINSKI